MFAEDTTLFFRDFADPCTLQGATLRAIFDARGVDELGVITSDPSALVRAEDAPAAAPGQTFVRSGTIYTVRQVLPELPDGQLVRLVLTRAA